MSETDLMRAIQIECCRDPNVRLFRNNVGGAWVNGRFMLFGLGEGTSDLIGWRSITITPEMVGKRIAVFTGLEVKSKKGRATDEQLSFIQVVKDLGGISDLVRSVEQARAVLTR